MLRFVSPLVVALALANQASNTSEADWQWLALARAAALEALMPVTAHSNQLVAYRAYRDLYQDVREVYFRIERDPSRSTSGDGLLASLVVPVGRSVQQQLLTLHMASPDASLDSLLPRVVVERIVVESRVCPSVRARVDALSRLSISIPEQGIIPLHPLVHRLVVDGPTARIDGTLYGADAPVVRWAAETIRAIQACRGG